MKNPIKFEKAITICEERAKRGTTDKFPQKTSSRVGVTNFNHFTARNIKIKLLT